MHEDFIKVSFQHNMTMIKEFWKILMKRCEACHERLWWNGVKSEEIKFRFFKNFPGPIDWYRPKTEK